MARLSDATGRLFPVESTHIVGRSRSAQTVLASPDVSAQHLALSWDGEAWILRDLGSRNGTWLDGRRLPPGERVMVGVGVVIEVGGPAQRLVLSDAAPPVATATCGDRVIEGDARMLALPDDDDPAVVVTLDGGRGWILSRGENEEAVRSGLTVDIDGERWRLALPEPITRTVDGAGQPPPLACHFMVSRDEEYIEFSVGIGGTQYKLPARSYHEILYALARARLADEALPEIEQGWLYTSELVRELRLSPNQLYVGLHRARREIEALGTTDAAPLVQRRLTTRQLRIGIPHIRVDHQ